MRRASNDVWTCFDIAELFEHWYASRPNKRCILSPGVLCTLSSMSGRQAILSASRLQQTDIPRQEGWAWKIPELTEHPGNMAGRDRTLTQTGSVPWQLDGRPGTKSA